MGHQRAKRFASRARIGLTPVGLALFGVVIASGCSSKSTLASREGDAGNAGVVDASSGGTAGSSGSSDGAGGTGGPTGSGGSGGGSGGAPGSGPDAAGGAGGAAGQPGRGGAGGVPAFSPKLVILFAPHGRIARLFRPSGATTLNPPGTMALTSVGPTLEPLKPYLSRTLLVEGLDLAALPSGTTAASHLPQLMTGGIVQAPFGANTLNQGAAASLDQVVARVLPASPVPALNLGVWTSQVLADGVTTLTWSASAVPLFSENRPSGAALRIFQGLTPSNDQRLLIERANAIPDAHTQPGAAANAAFPEIVRVQLALTVEALAVGRTRVATVQLHGPEPQVIHSWVGATQTQQALAHAADFQCDPADPVTPTYSAIEHWYSEQVAAFLASMAARNGPTGRTLLEETAVVWVSDVGGQCPRAHASRDVPVLIFGSLGGRLKTGVVVTYDGTLPLTNLWLTLAREFGSTATTFGGTGNRVLTEVLGP